MSTVYSLGTCTRGGVSAGRQHYILDAVVRHVARILSAVIEVYRSRGERVTWTWRRLGGIEYIPRARKYSVLGENKKNYSPSERFEKRKKKKRKV